MVIVVAVAVATQADRHTMTILHNPEEVVTLTSMHSSFVRLRPFTVHVVREGIMVVVEMTWDMKEVVVGRKRNTKKIMYMKIVVVVVVVVVVIVVAERV